MIISRMDGGLGNQMFQYAYGLYLARRNRTRLLLDTSSYVSQPHHGYLLDQFQIQASIADSNFQSEIPRRYRLNKAAKSVADLFGAGSLRRHKERQFGFREEHLRVPDKRYLVGYWQSEKFFPGMRDELLRHFVPANSIGDGSRDVSQRIANTNSVAIHVRRGDYITATSAAEIYEHLDLDYYRNSLAHWSSLSSDLEVFVFSNDMAWCKAHIDLPWKTHWVDHNNCETAYEDLWLMSKAACCVIANSTFSWWSAFLNNRPGRVIYAPSRWFRSGVSNDTHIVCTDWRKTQLSNSKIAA